MPGAGKQRLFLRKVVQAGGCASALALASRTAFAAPIHGVIEEGELALLIGAVILLSLCAVLLYRRQFLILTRRTRELRVSEKRFRMIIEGTSVVAWEYDLGSDSFTYVSASAVSLLGFPLAAWRASGFWHARLHPDDSARVLRFIRGMNQPGRQYECEYRLLTAEGCEVHVRDSRTVVESHAGHVAGMRGVLVDISAYKASEAALEDSEARFRGAFEQAAVGVALCSVSGRYLRVNPRFCEIVGYEMSDLLLRDFRELTHPDDIEINECLLDALVLGVPEHPPIEKRIRRRDGREVWVRLSMSLIATRHGTGQFMEVIEDVTARRLAEWELRDREGRLLTILRSLQEGVVMRDGRGEVVASNDAARQILGLSYDEAFPSPSVPRGVGFIREDGSIYDAAGLPEMLAMSSGEPARGVVGIDRRDGSRCWILSRAEPLERDPSSGRFPVVITMFDITESRQSEEALRLAASVFDHSVEAIMITDARRRILSVNKAFTGLTGFASEEVIGQTPAMLSVTHQGRNQYEETWRAAEEQGNWQGEVWQRRRDGSEFPEWLSIGAVRDRAGLISNYVAVFSDITERKASEARIAFLAHHDPLTGLPNRVLFQARLDQALARAERRNGRVALLFLDLDRFKTINDSLGHLSGDRLLQAVAQRLQNCVHDADTICRQGGDEFIIVLSEVADAEVPARVAEKILRRLAEPFDIDGHVLGTSFSIGISIYPEDGQHVDRLMKNADTAMYHAKESGRNTYRFFTERMNANALERLQLESLLRGALERNELTLYFQPQLNLHRGAVVGAEALLRWKSGLLGFLPPGRFIPVAEESGLIIPIGRWVLREACRQAAGWYRSGVRGVTVAVNISALQFRRDDIVANVAHALAEAGLPAELLELELTESLLMDQAEEMLETVQRLKRLGVRLSIDDFGTGYSSLSYLKRFAVDRLKIDQSFVRDIVEDPDDAAIVRAVIQLGRSLKLDVIAEGAETLAQIDFLMREGCCEAQGYYFCPPVSGEAFAAMLAHGHSFKGFEESLR